MFYKLLGYIVWNGFKLFLRQRYGSTVVPKPVAGGRRGGGRRRGRAGGGWPSRRNGSGRAHGAQAAAGSGTIAAVAESPSAVPALPGLAVTAVEWLPSGAESGLIRVRGRWTDEHATEPDLPVLALRAAERRPPVRLAARRPLLARAEHVARHLPRAAELVETDPEALWLEWPSGARAGLPALSRGVEPPRVPAAPERPEEPDEPGGQVIDRAVLAERRARRAEAAEEAQARVAAEALKAVEVLELRSAELERRLEEATAERDALGSDAGRREALAAALASAAALRSRSREWQVRLRTNEVARAGDAVRLAVLEAERAGGAAAMRSALDERGAELATARHEAAGLAAELETARAEAAERAAVGDRARAKLPSVPPRWRLRAREAAERAAELETARGEAAAVPRSWRLRAAKPRIVAPSSPPPAPLPRRRARISRRRISASTRRERPGTAAARSWRRRSLTFAVSSRRRARTPGCALASSSARPPTPSSFVSGSAPWRRR